MDTRARRYSLKPAIFITMLLILSACASSGYSRSYIISDVAEEEAVSSSPEKR